MRVRRNSPPKKPAERPPILLKLVKMRLETAGKPFSRSHCLAVAVVNPTLIITPLQRKVNHRGQSIVSVTPNDPCLSASFCFFLSPCSRFLSPPLRSPESRADASGYHSPANIANTTKSTVHSSPFRFANVAFAERNTAKKSRLILTGRVYQRATPLRRRTRPS